MVTLRGIRVLAAVLVMQLCIAAPDDPPAADPVAAGAADPAAAGKHEDDFEVGEFPDGEKCSEALNMDPGIEYKFGLNGSSKDNPNEGYKDMKHLWQGILGCAKNLVGLGKELQKRSKIATHKNAQYARDFSRVEYTLDYLAGNDVLNAFAVAHRLQKLSYLRTLAENVAWMQHLSPYTSWNLQQIVNEYKPPEETEAYNMMQEKKLSEVRGQEINPQQYDRFYNVPERILGSEARHRLQAKEKNEPGTMGRLFGALGGGTGEAEKNEDLEDHYGSHYTTKDIDTWQKLDQDDERQSVKDFVEAVHDSVNGEGIEEGAERASLKHERTKLKRLEKGETIQQDRGSQAAAQASRQDTATKTREEQRALAEKEQAEQAVRDRLQAAENAEQAAEHASQRRAAAAAHDDLRKQHAQQNGVSGTGSLP